MGGNEGTASLQPRNAFFSRITVRSWSAARSCEFACCAICLESLFRSRNNDDDNGELYCVVLLFDKFDNFVAREVDAAAALRRDSSPE